MSDLSVSVDLQENYKDYYQNGESKWRWLGALDKADNIISLCRGLSVNSLVEIGAGDGAILKRLSELSFANNFYALDISGSKWTEIDTKEDFIKAEKIFCSSSISQEINATEKIQLVKQPLSITEG